MKLFKGFVVSAALMTAALTLTSCFESKEEKPAEMAAPMAEEAAPATTEEMAPPAEGSATEEAGQTEEAH